MGKNALYTKYRPFQLDDIVGQDTTIQTLKQASKHNKFAHAYVLVGNKGCGKCIVGDSLVSVDGGLKSIETIVKEPLADSHLLSNNFITDIAIRLKDETGIGKTTNGYYEKDSKTIRIITRDGYSIEGTVEHPIRILNTDGKLVWKQMEDLEIGDFCAIFREKVDKGDAAININWEFDFNAYIEKYKAGDASKKNRILCQLKKYDVPKKMTVDLARFVGYFVSEGHINKNKGHISISNLDANLLNDCVRIIKKNFGYTMRRSVDKRNGVTTLSINSIYISQFLSHIGCNGDSFSKEIPPVILQSTKLLKAFLSGYFEGDGYVENNRKSIGCSSSSPLLAKQIHIALLKFGIVSTLKTRFKKYRNKSKQCNIISICSKNTSIFNNEIGFLSEKKISNALAVSNANVNPNIDTIPHLSGKLDSIRSLFPIHKNGRIVCDGKNLGRAKKWHLRSSSAPWGMSEKNVEYILDYLSGFIAVLGEKCNQEVVSYYNTLLELKTKNYFYSPIVEKSYGRNDVYDVCKEGEDKSFISNGFISHNTSTARILANLLTCSNPKDGVLCGECTACKTVPHDTAMDVIELDGAANGNVEHVNSLIDGAQWTPNVLTKKVYIIDECHQLSGKAISALLKIVEEPPEYLTFIFCTTEAHKIPDTILSRSQRFIYRKLSMKDITGRLRYIADQEKIKITDEALFGIAKLSRGCMRDAIVPLEQISTFVTDTEITGAHIYKYFGLPDRQGILQICKAMIEGNISLVLDQANDMVVASADIASIAYEVSEAFRGITLLKAQNGESKWIDLPDHEIEQLKKIGASLKLGQLDKLSKLFSTLRKELEYSINERWVLESTLIHCTALLRKTP